MLRTSKSRALMLAVLLMTLVATGCGGGGSSDAPSRVAIEDCLRHAGGLVSARERRAEIGGLPARVEITMRDRQSPGVEVYVGLFKTPDEADEATAVLEEASEGRERPASIKAYSDGSVVGIVVGSQDPAKGEAFLEECAAGDEGAVAEVEAKEAADLAAVRESERNEATAEREAVAACLEEGSVTVEQHVRHGYEEVAGIAKDEGVVAIYLFSDSSEAAKAISELKTKLKDENPGALVTAGIAGNTAVAATAGADAGSPLASEADEALARRCAAGV